jgi:outer membrane biosynthesis protein TonB
MKRITEMILIVAALIPASAQSQVCVKQLSVPDYPPVAQAAQWTGVIDLTVKVGERGQVVGVDGSTSPPILAQKAKENVKEWVFCTPRNSKARTCVFNLTIVWKAV